MKILTDIHGGYYIPISFHVTGSLTTGVKIPKFIAPVALSVVSMYARVDTGTGVACRPSKNSGSSDGTELTSISSTVSNNSQSLSLAAGDTLCVNVTTASSGTHLSVTFWAKVT